MPDRRSKKAIEPARVQRLRTIHGREAITAAPRIQLDGTLGYNQPTLYVAIGRI